MIPNSDFQVRLVGAALELIGVATVWQDLSCSMTKTGGKGVWARTLEWLRAGLRGPTKHIAAGFIGGANAVMGGHATLRHTVGPDASLEDRVAGIEKNVDQLYQQAQQAREMIDLASAEARKELAQERETRERQIGDVQRDLIDFATGSYSTLLFGVVWLCVGLLLSAFSPEIVQLRG